MALVDNLNSIKQQIPDKVTLVAISKTHPAEKVQELYDFGHKDFGENKVQELISKAEILPKDILWHFVGHLQSNKVKFIAPFIHLIHSVDSMKLLKEINKAAAQNNRVVNCLLQIFIADEITKYGLSVEELKSILSGVQIKEFQNIRICGLMGMATNTDDNEQIRSEFRGLKELFDQIKRQYFPEEETFNTLSMGMSGDYELAIEEGSTMIRVGSLIFGEREYK